MENKQGQQTGSKQPAQGQIHPQTKPGCSEEAKAVTEIMEVVDSLP